MLDTNKPLLTPTHLHKLQMLSTAIHIIDELNPGLVPQIVFSLINADPDLIYTIEQLNLTFNISTSPSAFNQQIQEVLTKQHFQEEEVVVTLEAPYTKKIIPPEEAQSYFQKRFHFGPEIINYISYLYEEFQTSQNQTEFLSKTLKKKDKYKAVQLRKALSESSIREAYIKIFKTFQEMQSNPIWEQAPEDFSPQQPPTESMDSSTDNNLPVITEEYSIPDTDTQTQTSINTPLPSKTLSVSNLFQRSDSYEEKLRKCKEAAQNYSQPPVTIFMRPINEIHTISIGGKTLQSIGNALKIKNPNLLSGYKKTIELIFDINLDETISRYIESIALLLLENGITTYREFYSCTDTDLPLGFSDPMQLKYLFPDIRRARIKEQVMLKIWEKLEAIQSQN